MIKSENYLNLLINEIIILLHKNWIVILMELRKKKKHILRYYVSLHHHVVCVCVCLHICVHSHFNQTLLWIYDYINVTYFNL